MVNGFKWVANIDEPTIDNLKNEIKDRLLSPLLDDGYYATLKSSYENLSPKK